MAMKPAQYVNGRISNSNKGNSSNDNSSVTNRIQDSNNSSNTNCIDNSNMCKFAMYTNVLYIASYK